MNSTPLEHSRTALCAASVRGCSAVLSGWRKSAAQELVNAESVKEYKMYAQSVQNRNTARITAQHNSGAQAG